MHLREWDIQFAMQGTKNVGYLLGNERRIGGSESKRCGVSKRQREIQATARYPIGEEKGGWMGQNGVGYSNENGKFRR